MTYDHVNGFSIIVYIMSEKAAAASKEVHLIEGSP